MLPIGIGYTPGSGCKTVARFLTTHLRTAQQNKGDIRTTSMGFEAQLICHRIFKWAGLQYPDYYNSNPSQKEVILPKIEKTPSDIWADFEVGVSRIAPTTLIQYTLSLYKDVDILIITDIAFIRDYEVINGLGGFVICVDRFNVTKGSLRDYTINNDGDLGKLYDETVKAIGALGL